MLVALPSFDACRAYRDAGDSDAHERIASVDSRTPPAIWLTNLQKPAAGKASPGSWIGQIDIRLTSSLVAGGDRKSVV